MTVHTMLYVVKHNYADVGEYTVGATVEDDVYSAQESMTQTIPIFGLDIMHRLSKLPLIFAFSINNNVNYTIGNISWSCDMGDNNTIESLENLTIDDSSFIYMKHEYDSGGNYVVNCTATNTTTTDYEDIFIHID